MNTSQQYRIGSWVALGCLALLAMPALAVAPDWSTAGNAGTAGGTSFVGTTDNQALDFRVNNTRAFRLQPSSGAPNIVGGYSGNTISAGVYASSITGGGYGGRVNSITSNNATICGGSNNSVTGAVGTIVGGSTNSVSGIASTVAGGFTNQAKANYSFIGGGSMNITTQVGTGNVYSTIAGGFTNTASGLSAVIAGGQDNEVSDDYCVVGGGKQNIAGDQNADSTTAANATIAGGVGNWAYATASTVGGGDGNVASGEYSVVGGGWHNYATKVLSTVGGGSENFANGNYGTVGGGNQNHASGQFSTVAGGNDNTASGTESTVPGGILSAAAGDFSFAAGRRAKANAQGSFAWADSTDADFAVGTQDRFGVRASGGVTFYTNAGLTAGVSVAAGGGSWASVSDRNVKEEIMSVDAKEILDKVANLPVATWKYKSEEGARHMGPMAQDMYAAFGLGDSDKSITTIDADGVALAAIQGLNQRLQEKDAQISELRATLAQQASEMAALKAAVQGLTAK